MIWLKFDGAPQFQFLQLADYFLITEVSIFACLLLGRIFVFARKQLQASLTDL